ncbi:MAG: M15 family metallopeptidase [Syntrophomonadaceae bacterium]|jgi:D-alanyl-D-alanine dipeptidase
MENRNRLIVFIAITLITATFFYLQSPPFKKQAVQNTSEKLSQQDMVALNEYIPDLKIDLRYATAKNFTGTKIYEKNIAYLRRGTAEKLKAAQAEFSSMGYTIKVWDAYRPPAAQFSLWNSYPDSRFVINPHKGFSYHSRGVAVDVTLVKGNKEIPMPTGFDDFTARANRDYSDVSKEVADNARLLEQIMVKHGFNSIFYEWWHFIDQDKDQYPVYYLE